jgi:hypothetical protein
LVTAVLGVILFVFSSSDTFAWNSTEKRTLPYYTCYGVSNLTKNSTVGVMGESTTICDRTTNYLVFEIYVSGTLVRDGRPVDSVSRTIHYSDSIKEQTFYDDKIFRSGKYTLTSSHRVVSGFDHGDVEYWNSEWTRSF